MPALHVAGGDAQARGAGSAQELEEAAVNVVSVLCFMYVAWCLGRERYPVRWLIGLGVMVVVAASWLG